MSDLQEKIINKIGLEFGRNYSESSLKDFADEVIALVGDVILDVPTHDGTSADNCEERSIVSYRNDLIKALEGKK